MICPTSKIPTEQSAEIEIELYIDWILSDCLFFVIWSVTTCQVLSRHRNMAGTKNKTQYLRKPILSTHH